MYLKESVTALLLHPTKDICLPTGGSCHPLSPCPPQGRQTIQIGCTSTHVRNLSACKHRLRSKFKIHHVGWNRKTCQWVRICRWTSQFVTSDRSQRKWKSLLHLCNIKSACLSMPKSTNTDDSPLPTVQPFQLHELKSEKHCVGHERRGNITVRTVFSFPGGGVVKFTTSV